MELIGTAVKLAPFAFRKPAQYKGYVEDDSVVFNLLRYLAGRPIDPTLDIQVHTCTCTCMHTCRCTLI